MKLKRLLSLLLALTMVLSMAPVSAHAAKNCSHQEDHDMLTASNGYQTYGYLTEEFGLAYMDGMYYNGESEPTCTSPYFTYWACEECGFSIREMLPGFPALGHDFGSWRTVQEATCTQNGLELGTCSRCGETTTRKSADMLDHNWTWKLTLRATCTKTGTEEGTCSMCGTTTFRAVSPLGHDFQSWTVKTPATCTETGLEESKCSRCSEAQTRTIAALGHDFKGWTVKTPATCTKEGTETSKCSRCSEEQTRSIPKTGHDFGDWVTTKPATDDDDGEEIRTCKTCKEEEHRTVRSFQIGKGDTGLHVFVLQALLHDYGTYTGALDGKFTDELGEAVTAWQQSHGLTVTGVAHTSTFNSLVDVFAQDHKDPNPNAVLEVWDCGLVARYSFTVNAVSNEDGTHTADYHIFGVSFEREDENGLIFGSPAVDARIDGALEACLLGNAQHKCIICGYRPETIAENIPDIPMDGGFALMFLPPVDELELNPVENLHYNEGTWVAFWDAFPGADEYRFEIYCPGKSGSYVDTYTSNVYFDMYDFLNKNGQGTYKLIVTAVKDYQEISALTCIAFHYGSQLNTPRDLQVSATYAAWENDAVLHSASHYCYQVSVYTSDGELQASATTRENWIDLLPLLHDTKIEQEHLDFYVTLQSVDLFGNCEDSEIIRSETVHYVEPTYYVVNMNCNVRALPTKESDRIGGVKAGTVIAVTDIKDGYLQFQYNGQDGWVMGAACALSEAHYHRIVIDPNTTEIPAHQEELWTDYTGRLDAGELLHLQTYWSDESLLNNVTHFTDTDGNEVDSKTVFDHAVRINAQWEKDPRLVTLRLYTSDGEFIEEKPALPGTPFYDYLPMNVDGLVVTAWTTEQGTDYLPDDYIPENVKNQWDLFAQLASDNWYTVKNFTVIREKADNDSQILAMLEPGDRVLFLEDVRLGKNEENTYVKVSAVDGVEGYLCLKDLFYWSKTRVVTLKGNGGWCNAAKMYVDYSLDLAKLPVPTRDGYIFTGWRLTEGIMKYREEQLKVSSVLRLDSSDRYGYFLTDVTLEAQWLETNAENTRTGFLAADPASFRDSQYLYAEPGKNPIRAINENQALYTLVDVIGNKEYDRYGKSYYRVLLPTGETGFVYTSLICLDYSIIELISGKYMMYDTARTESAYGKKVVVRPFTTAIATAWGNGRTRAFADYDHDGDLESYWIENRRIVGSTCKVVFDPNGGVLVGDRFMDVPGGTKLTTPQFPYARRADSDFIGWYTDPIGGRLVAVDYVFEEGITLYAHYQTPPVRDTTKRFIVSRVFGVPAYVDEAMTKYVSTLSAGEVIEAEYVRNPHGDDYYTVQYGGQTCYIKEADVEVVTRYMTMVSEVARSTPSKKGRNLGGIPAGGNVFAFDYNDGWYEIVWINGENCTAYMRANDTISKT